MAELRPIDPLVRPQTLDERVLELERSGAIVPARRAPGEANAFPIVAKKGGALKRFLSERD